MPSAVAATPAAARCRDDLHELSVLVEDGQPLVVAVGDDDAALQVDGNAVRDLQFTGRGSFLAADDADELAVAGEMDDAGIAVAVGDVDVAVRGRPDRLAD